MPVSPVLRRRASAAEVRLESVREACRAMLCTGSGVWLHSSFVGIPQARSRAPCSMPAAAVSGKRGAEYAAAVLESLV